MFHYIVENGVTYLCMADEQSKRRVPFAFLEVCSTLLLGRFQWGMGDITLPFVCVCVFFLLVYLGCCSRYIPLQPIKYAWAFDCGVFSAAAFTAVPGYDVREHGVDRFECP